MKLPRFLHRLIFLVIAVVAVLGIVGSTFYPHAIAQAASAKKWHDSAHVFGARPLWQYARKISSTSIGQGQIPPCLTSAVPPRCYGPQQIRKAYNIQSLLNAGITGKGHTIILIEGSTSPTLEADVHLYDQLYGLRDPELRVFAPFGSVFDPGAYVETALDVEIAHAIAPGAAIDIVLGNISLAFSPGGFLSALLRATKFAVDNNLGDVLSQSFGVGESCAGSAYLQAEQQVFAEARAKHISVLASSGDSGAAVIACSGPQIFLAKGISLPAADPLATAVGGTTLDAAVNTGKYISETTWNESNAGDGATGGGFSSLFPVPAYQSGIAGITSRGVPDVAFDGDPFTGVPIVVSINGATIIAPVGGTSVGSPVWAAIVALANQFAGRRVGFLNDAVYGILQSPSYEDGFHDITTGDNTVTVPGPTGNPVTLTGYNAGPGWDAVTGAGTPKVSSLVRLLEGFSNS